MKKCLRFLLVLILCFINIKIGKCAIGFSFGEVEVYDINHKAVDNMQRGKTYNLEYQFYSFPSSGLTDTTQCVVLNINTSGDVLINSKTQESLTLGCGNIISQNIYVPIEVPNSSYPGEVSVNIDSNIIVYELQNPQNQQFIPGPTLRKQIFNPILSVQVQTDKEYYKQNDTVEFTLNVTNNGPSFEDAVIAFQIDNLKLVQVTGDITHGNSNVFNLKNMETFESKEIKVEAIIKGANNFYVSVIPHSLDLQYSGNILFQKDYRVYKPNVVTTNTFNLEDIQDDEEYSFKIKFTNNSVVSSGKFTSSFALDERLELLSAESATIDGNKLTWNIDDIEAGEFVEYTIKVKKIKEIDDEVVINPDIDYEEDKDEPQLPEDENKDDENQNNNNTNKPSNEYADKEAENPKTADQNYMIISVVGVLLIILATVYFKGKNKKQIFKV